MSDGDVRDYRSPGEILRDAREKKGWSVEELHERTRIAPRMIRALESDDFDQFDSPVYARGFVRQLADALDVDADWLLTKLGLPERKAVESPGVVPPVTPESTPATPPTAPPVSERGPVWEVESVRVRRIAPEASGGGRGRWIVLAVATLVIIGAVVLWTLWPLGEGVRPRIAADEPHTRETIAGERGTEATATEEPAIAPQEPPAEETTAGPAEGGEAVAEATPAPRTSPDTRTGTPPVDELEWHPSTAPSPVDERTAERSAAGPEDADLDQTAESTVEEEGRSEPARADATSTPARRDEVVESTEPDGGLPSVVRGRPDADAPLMRLVITARERVEIWIEHAHDDATRSRVLEAGDVWRLTGTDHFLIRASDPDAADYELDGIVREPPPQWDGTEWYLRPERPESE